MARPRKEGLDYFPHDTYLDDKIEFMETKYGLAGHAFYFKLCERIYRTDTAELDVSDAETMQVLAKNFHMTLKRFNEMLTTAMARGLFDKELFYNSKRLSSNGIKRRCESVSGKREASRQKYHESKLNDVVSDAETTQKQGVSAEFLVHKEKESKSKEKESKLNNIVLPDFIDKVLWTDFLEMRKKLKRPATDKAQELLIKDLDKLRAEGNDPNEVLRQSIKSSWQGLFPLKGGNGNGAYRGNPSQKPAGAFSDIES